MIILLLFTQEAAGDAEHLFPVLLECKPALSSTNTQSAGVREGSALRVIAHITDSVLNIHVFYHLHLLFTECFHINDVFKFVPKKSVFESLLAVNWKVKAFIAAAGKMG